MHRLGRAAALGTARHEMGYGLGPLTWLQPDVSNTHADQPLDKYLEGSSALAVEIISESNTPRKIALKVEVFLTHGALEIWVIYPDRRELLLHRPAAAVSIHSGRFPADLLEGAEIDLDEILGPI
jgi:Uma2 family endonuclease